MDHIAIATTVFACVFGSALIGLLLQRILPAHHLSNDSAGVIKLSTGLIATMAALVLGLLVSSAKVSFDTEESNLVHNAAAIVRLDRILANYGPETHDIRAQMKLTYAESIEIMSSGQRSQISRLGSPEAIARTELFSQRLQSLRPINEAQAKLQAHALDILDGILAARWLTLLESQGAIPVSLLVVLVMWLSIIFGSFGMFAPRNGTIITAFLVCALSASGAIFLTEELSTPLDGLARISLTPMRAALELLGQ